MAALLYFFWTLLLSAYIRLIEYWITVLCMSKWLAKYTMDRINRLLVATSCIISLMPKSHKCCLRVAIRSGINSFPPKYLLDSVNKIRFTYFYEMTALKTSPNFIMQVLYKKTKVFFFNKNIGLSLKIVIYLQQLYFKWDRFISITLMYIWFK